MSRPAGLSAAWAGCIVPLLLAGCTPSLVVRLEGSGELKLFHALVVAGDSEQTFPLYGELPDRVPLPVTFGLALPGVADEGVRVCVTGDLEGQRVVGCGSGDVEAGEIVVAICPQFLPGSIPPRGIAPLNASYVGSVHRPGTLRPELRWGTTLVNGAAPLGYELRYFSDDVGMNDARYVLTAGNSYTPEEDLLVSTEPPVGRRYFWQVRAAFEDGSCTGWSPRRYVDVGRSPKDLNGDGIDDLVVGAPGLDIGGDMDAGAVYVFLGPITLAPTKTPDDAHPSTTADIVFPGLSPFDRFGESVAYLGDFNGDGFSDLTVGAPGAGMSAGTISILFGGEDPESMTPLEFAGLIAGAEGGTTVSSAGDFDADGYADIAIATPPGALGTSAVFLFRGNPDRDTGLLSLFGFGAPFDLYGRSIASAGDVNGDGFGDLIIGAPGTEVDDTTGPDGAAYIYLGGLGIRSSFPDVEIFAPEPDLYYGWSVSAAGDMDGDGYGDLFIGAPGQSMAGPPGNQRVDIFYGSGSLPEVWSADATILPTNVNGGFGFTVARGDANGDGCTDLAVGLPFAMNLAVAGGVGAFLALPCGRVNEVAPEEKVRNDVLGPAGMGFALGFLDWNGDGLDDLALGGPGPVGAGANSAGRLLIFPSDGATPAPGSALVPMIQGIGMNDRFGASIAGY